VTPVGVLQGSNPLNYSASDPLVLFSVQVRPGCKLALTALGIHHYCDMSSASLSPVQDPATPGHRRSHWYALKELLLTESGGILLGPSYRSYWICANNAQGNG
jgi:hypothetical protein